MHFERLYHVTYFRSIFSMLMWFVLLLWYPNKYFDCVLADVWKHFHKTVVMKYSERMNGVNIISGPIFDRDYNGHYDDQTKRAL